jgi:dTDP-4-amino-4,6-dideoxygalactose transaminase
LGNATIRVPFVDLKAQYLKFRSEMESAVCKVLESAHFIGGPVLEQFEREFAEFVGARFCVGVANGTDAITLAARASGIGAGDEVLVPANSFFATAEAISNAGARPVFVDVDPDTFHVDPKLASAAITPKTKAIVPVHLYGRVVDMAPIEALAQHHNLIIIEDCAQAHGVSLRGRTVGSSGRLTCYSFYPGKNLGAYGDGGAVTTSDPQLAQSLRMLREHGSRVKYEHDAIGWNSRLDALQAAVLSVKLPHLQSWNESRRKHAARLANALAGSPIIPPAVPAGSEHTFHLFVVRCSQRDELREFLAGMGIQTGIHYPVPLHLTRAYRGQGAPGPGSMPVAERLANQIVSLPMYPELTDEQVAYVVDGIQDFTRSFQPSALEDVCVN